MTSVFYRRGERGDGWRISRAARYRFAGRMAETSSLAADVGHVCALRVKALRRLSPSRRRREAGRDRERSRTSVFSKPVFAVTQRNRDSIAESFRGPGAAESGIRGNVPPAPARALVLPDRHHRMPGEITDRATQPRAVLDRRPIG